MRRKVFGRLQRNRNWGKTTRIDSYDRLQLVLGLLKDDVPIGISIDLYPLDYSGKAPAPHAYDPRRDTPLMVSAPLPVVAEVRMSLYRNETLAWVLPLRFAIDRFLTTGEVATKIAEAKRLLQAWAQVHAGEAREHLGTHHNERHVELDSKYAIH
jgi:hypothetical protein